MKKILIIAMAICAIQTSTAQHHEKGRKAMDLTPEEMATLHTKKMTLHLDLNQSQQDAVYAINLENAKLRKARMEERKAKKENGNDTKPTKEERYEMANKILDHKIAVKAKMKEILNDEQFAKWEKAQARKHAKKRGKVKKKHADRK